MSKKGRKQKMARLEGHKDKTLFCPQCGTMMRYVTTKKDQHRVDPKTRKMQLDEEGNPMLVRRAFYGCPKCMTACWFDYRQDGKMGDLYRELTIQEFSKGMKMKQSSSGFLITPDQKD